MFCSNCGKELNVADNFCPQCGKKIGENVVSQTEVLAQAEAEEQLETGRLLLVNPETGCKSYMQLTEEKAKAINSGCKDDDYYINLIDNWEMNPQLKEICKKLVSMTKTVGGHVLRIGKWVLDLAKDIAKQIMQKFPTMVIGAAIGFCFGMVFTTIPILGWLLGGFVTPVLTLTGAGIGFFYDAKNSLLVKKITAEVFAAQKIIA